jgi:hypothetical protein
MRIENRRHEMRGGEFYTPVTVKMLPYRNVYEENHTFPEHDLVIRPLLENCIYSYIYVPKENIGTYSNNKDILIREKGKYRLDLSKECIKGHERLWNCYDYDNDHHNYCSIIIIMKSDFNLFDKIFENTFNPSVMGTPNTGNSISALKKCKEEMEKGNFGICISWCCNLSYMLIYTKRHDELLEMAINKCKKIDLSFKAEMEKLKEVNFERWRKEMKELKDYENE